ncbi:MAG: PhoPQ-activated pathogenicity protein [Phycisphaeraceae bacterium]|nr:PhoPQ-activated pathogenicity protein [Phycisphaeraceae bacterium]
MLIRRAAFALLAVILAAPLCRAEISDSTLVSYVQKPDDSFSYQVRQHMMLGATEAYELTMTSQTWHGITWKHRVFVVKPSKIYAEKQGLLLIAGGRWREGDDQPPTAEGAATLPKEAMLFATIAERLGSPVVVLMQVPFQPIFNNLREDAAIAYTFDQYLNTQQADWPLLLPMVKSAVRAMDAGQKFFQEQWGLNVEHFTVTGASKRGWTTWLTGAVDPRVNAIAPMVIDVLNMQPQMKHQVETWGTFSQMIHDYTELGIIDRFEEPAGQELQRIVDPYAYRDRITMPKLIVLGTNDPYWPLDALNLYWDGLIGQKRILYVPNAGHSLETGLTQVVAGVVAVHRAAAGMLQMPMPQWSFEEDEDGLAIEVRSDQTPRLVQAWSSNTPTRDFRGSGWTPQTLIAESDGPYRFHLPRPQEGHSAAYVELIYQDGDLTYTLTTQLRIIGTTKEVTRGG